jgi:transketolase
MVSPSASKEIRGAKRFYGWPEDESFLVPEKVRSHFADLGRRGAGLRESWDELFGRYGKEYPS